MNDNRTAKQLSGDYHQALEAAINTYCLLKDRRPFDQFPIHKARVRVLSDLMTFWGDMGMKLTQTKRQSDEGGL